MKTSIQLNQFVDEYLPQLYEIFSDQEQRLNILPQRQYITSDQFEKTFKRHIESKYTEFKIISDNEHDFIGFVIAYDYMRNDSHLKVTVYIKPEFQHSTYGFVAVVKFIDFLFNYYNLNKVFTEVYSFNEASVALHTTFGFKQEASLSEYKYYNGKYYDMIIYSIKRENFYERIEKLRLL